MKKINGKIAMILTALALVFIVFGVSSCKKDSTTTPPVIVLDGYYIYGAATPYPGAFNSNAIMKVTKNEVTQTDRASLLELYISLKAGTAGFNIISVAGSVQTTYSPGTGFGIVATPTTDEPKVPFQRGPVVKTATAMFNVPEDGFYHVVLDDSLNIAAIMRVHWGMIGAATPGGWSNDTMLTESAFNATDMTWNLTGFKLMKGDWKFRYSHGWKVEIDTAVVIGSVKGVKVNTNFGGASGALVPGGANIVNADPGIYTINLAYKLGTGYTATLTKTGNIPPIDYSAYQMGIIGSCYKKADSTQANWDENFGTMLPVVTGGTTYTWTYNIPINLAGDFKFRQGSDWAGKSIGYSDVTMAGPAAANFSDDGGNFKVSITGNYTIVLQIDAATETYTVTATKN
jgi:hypothetical protein